MNTKILVRTAILLAVCVVFQLLKGISVYITGPVVNAVLIIAALSCGWQSGLLIAVLTPLIAFLVGATPILNAVPTMLPVIMAGNACITMSAWAFRRRLLWLGLLIGSGLKALLLWLLVWFWVLPVFGTALPPKMQTAARLAFSWTQLFTALLGSLLAWVIWYRLKKSISNP